MRGSPPPYLENLVIIDTTKSTRKGAQSRMTTGFLACPSKNFLSTATIEKTPSGVV